jgi:hypothetical protein
MAMGDATVSGRLLVFSQRPETTLDVGACDAHAQRFFGVALEGTASEGLVVSAPGGAKSLRTVRGRVATAADLALAVAAEELRGGGGLAGLARRCPTIWEVHLASETDVEALRIAAILASVLLGPIVDRRGPEIFGVKTAREKLALAGANNLHSK